MSSKISNEEKESLLNLFERTRQGKNPCPKCGRPMDMYFHPWCPLCDKPQLRGRELNFYKALEHIEALGNRGFRDRVWSVVAEEYQFRNDSAFLLCFPGEEGAEAYSKQHAGDLELIRSTFDLDDCVLMWASW